MGYTSLPGTPPPVWSKGSRGTLFAFGCLPARVAMTYAFYAYDDQCSYQCRLVVGLAAFAIAYVFYARYVSSQKLRLAPNEPAWCDRQRMVHFTLWFAVGVAAWSEWSNTWLLVATDTAVGALLGGLHFTGYA